MDVIANLISDRYIDQTLAVLMIGSLAIMLSLFVPMDGLADE